MKLKFKVQPYQTRAVESVIDCFAGQPFRGGFSYRVDPGYLQDGTLRMELDAGLRNAELALSETELLSNIRNVQDGQFLRPSEQLASSAGCKTNLDVEMETGTGKTYVYIKTMFELNKRYGWSKFIVVVPSIAIREGVVKSFEITAEHFLDAYGRRARAFTYNSRQLHELENFSSNSGINVMVINIQAFNATGKDNLRIYDELDDFQSRRPIDVIKANRPILILDEPQKMEGKKTVDALAKFEPLAILRYSATHRTEHNKVHRLDALDAYNDKLVKKIAVRGVSVSGLPGSNAYLFLESFEISKAAPLARIELEIRQGDGIRRKVLRLESGANLYDASNGLEQYRGFVLSPIDVTTGGVEFSNGLRIGVGQATSDDTEGVIRRIQIRETIKAHLDRERRLFAQGVKVLSLFFIDEVAKYRDYALDDTKGIYARTFESEYRQAVDEYLDELPLEADGYREFLAKTTAETSHSGYFSIDKKGQQVDPQKFERGGEPGEAKVSNDVDAYDLILRDKERLLSSDEPVRFLFSHSALREGWDNPNVFIICLLKHVDGKNQISRRQEVGRGLRLAVNRDGDRMDDPATVHEINELTVVANESYTEFVKNLQSELVDALKGRPQAVNATYFAGITAATPLGEEVVSDPMSNLIVEWLKLSGYLDSDGRVTQRYRDEKIASAIDPLPGMLEPFTNDVFARLDQVFNETELPKIADGRRSQLLVPNENFRKPEFQDLWNMINPKVAYRVDFDSQDLIVRAIKKIDSELAVTPMQYTVRTGHQREQIGEHELRLGQSFTDETARSEFHVASAGSRVKYDLVGSVAESTKLIRRTVVEILRGIRTGQFAKFRENPEQFLTEVSKLVNQEKALLVVEYLEYQILGTSYDEAIFSENAPRIDISTVGEKLRHHVYDYVATDSAVEREFARMLDIREEVAVFAKLPGSFVIPTPMGNYNPDWAVAFKRGTVRHFYFVAETKGSKEGLDLRGVENAKIQSARKFFDAINRNVAPQNVRYDVLTKVDQLIGLAGALE